MSLSVRVRFEVFKRDRFTCSYCGKSPPNVLLEVDHVIPRAAGGSDDIENLTTSCQDCNRGKSAGLLAEGSARVISQEAAAEAQERLEQTRMYAEAVAQMRRLNEAQVQTVIENWAYAFEATKEEQEDGTYWVLPRDRQFPSEATIRRLMGRGLNLDDLLEAIDITASRLGDYYRDEGPRYFYGVCWRMVDRLEGRER